MEQTRSSSQGWEQELQEELAKSQEWSIHPWGLCSSLGISGLDFPWECFMNQLDESLVVFSFFHPCLILFLFDLPRELLEQCPG